MRRRTRREKRSRNKKIVITSTMCLLLCLCVGYAAFNTQLSLKARGNIKEKKASDMLRELCNTESGDGLYKDKYEAGIVLVGCEVKSISRANCSINDAYITFMHNEAFIINMHVANFFEGCPIALL